MLFNSRSVVQVALAALIGFSELANAIPSSDSINHMQLKARHRNLNARRSAAVKRAEPVLPVLEDTPVKSKRSKKCPAKKPKPSNTPLANVESAPAPTPPSSGSQSRLDKIKSMYAFEGFVYSLEGCKNSGQITSDFKSMASHGARTVMTFGYCPSKDTTGDYENVIQAASDAGLHIILLVATLVTDDNSLYGGVIPRSKNMAKAIINRPNNVLALALGDEPLYDNDFGNVGTLASHINDLKGQFKAANLDVPISISDMAFGWQSAGQVSSSSAVAEAVDFFMVNTFPYFGQSASWGGNDGAFESFKKDISFFEGIASGRPILVTQTGWPTNTAEFAPNSNSIVASVGSSEAYWNLLNSHCSDFFKAKNIGWMWRNWDDTISGWGVKDSSGNFKFNIDGVKTTC